MVDTLGRYPGWSLSRSIVAMTSDLLNRLIVTGLIDDQILAASRGRLARELRRDSRAAEPSKRRWFPRRHAVSAPRA
jgi:hypothetical protein